VPGPEKVGSLSVDSKERARDQVQKGRNVGEGDHRSLILYNLSYSGARGGKKPERRGGKKALLRKIRTRALRRKKASRNMGKVAGETGRTATNP